MKIAEQEEREQRRMDIAANKEVRTYVCALAGTLWANVL